MKFLATFCYETLRSHRNWAWHYLSGYTIYLYRKLYLVWSANLDISIAIQLHFWIFLNLILGYKNALNFFSPRLISLGIVLYVYALNKRAWYSYCDAYLTIICIFAVVAYTVNFIRVIKVMTASYYTCSLNRQDIISLRVS